MKKKFLSLFLMMLLIVGLTLPVHAETYYGGANWRVAFTSDKKMDSNFRTADMDEAVSGLQPGDNIILKVAIRNDYEEATDWWMTNEVLHSLEDRSANGNTNGGAYTYILTYRDKDGEDILLFSSEMLGGDGADSAGVGLHGATAAMEDFFYLDTLSTGESGTLTLEVALDGETQGNDYQDTLADLQMNFAVELNPDGSSRRRLREMENDFTSRRTTEGYEIEDYDYVQLSDIVRTGDETNLTPYFIAMAVSGVFILMLAIYSMKQNVKEKKGAK